jgi:hypothetical protein
VRGDLRPRISPGLRQALAPGRAAESGELLRWLVHVNPFRREKDLRHFTEGCASRVSAK